MNKYIAPFLGNPVPEAPMYGTKDSDTPNNFARLKDYHIKGSFNYYNVNDI